MTSHPRCHSHPGSRNDNHCCTRSVVSCHPCRNRTGAGEAYPAGSKPAACRPCCCTRPRRSSKRASACLVTMVLNPTRMSHDEILEKMMKLVDETVIPLEPHVLAHGWKSSLP